MTRVESVGPKSGDLAIQVRLRFSFEFLTVMSRALSDHTVGNDIRVDRQRVNTEEMDLRISITFASAQTCGRVVFRQAGPVERHEDRV